MEIKLVSPLNTNCSSKLAAFMFNLTFSLSTAGACLTSLLQNSWLVPEAGGVDGCLKTEKVLK